MAITKISLDNFVVFKHTEVLPCPGVNVFIGKNGVGKTQLMKAIYAKMMSDKDKNRLLAEYFKRGGNSYELNSSLGTQPASNNTIMEAYNALLEEVYGLQVGD